MKKKLKLEVDKAVAKTMLGVFKEHLGADFAPVAGGRDGARKLWEFPLGNSHCRVAVMRCTERAAGVNVGVRLGRLHSGYRRALRWLAQNRAGNSVGLFSDESMLVRMITASRKLH